MSHTITRFIQKHLTKLQYSLSFRFSSLTLGWKISLWAMIVCWISLFFPWIIFISTWDIDEISSKISSTHSFSPLIGNSWLFIALWLIVWFFFLFSSSKKNILYSATSLSYKIYNVLFIIAIFILYTTLHSLLIIKWLQVFSSNITYSNWLVLCITWSIILIFWSLKLRNDSKKDIVWAYIHTSEKNNLKMKNDKIDEWKNNMKLPF